MTRTPKTDAPALDAETLALLAELANATKAQEGLTKKPRNSGPATIRTFYDGALLIKLANDLGENASWLDLGRAYQDADGKNSADWDDADSYHGPKLRTRISQLCNALTIGENFRPIPPKEQPLHFATIAAETLRAKLRAAGMTDDQIDAALAGDAENGS